jgi:hypothetical protein
MISIYNKLQPFEIFRSNLWTKQIDFNLKLLYYNIQPVIGIRSIIIEYFNHENFRIHNI